MISLGFHCPINYCKHSAMRADVKCGLRSPNLWIYPWLPLLLQAHMVWRKGPKSPLLLLWEGTCFKDQPHYCILRKYVARFVGDSRAYFFNHMACLLACQWIMIWYNCVCTWVSWDDDVFPREVKAIKPSGISETESVLAIGLLIFLRHTRPTLHFLLLRQSGSWSKQRRMSYL